VFDLDVARALILGFDGDRLWLVRDDGMGMGGFRGREGWYGVGVVEDEEEEVSVVGGLGFVLSICRSLASINAILSFVLPLSMC
jgi:hypothetical protein